MYHCKENGLPRQCAHWLAMTCRRQRRGYVCKGAVHDDIQRMETACGCKGANLPALGYGAAGDSTSPMYMASPKLKKR